MPLTLASEPRRNVGTPVILATFVLTVAIGAAFYFNPHRQGELKALRTAIFAPQTTYAAPKKAIHVIGEKPAVEQDLYAVVTVHLRNDLRVPLFVDEVDGRYLSAHDEEMDCVAPTSAELDRLQSIFPQLRPLMPHPLLLGDTVPPQSSRDGQVLLHFSGLGEKDWRGRMPSTLTMHFTHQSPLTVTIP